MAIANRYHSAETIEAAFQCCCIINNMLSDQTLAESEIPEERNGDNLDSLDPNFNDLAEEELNEVDVEVGNGDVGILIGNAEGTAVAAEITSRRGTEAAAAVEDTAVAGTKRTLIATDHESTISVVNFIYKDSKSKVFSRLY